MKQTIERLLRPLFFMLFCVAVISGPSVVTAGELIRINGSGSGLEMMTPLITEYSKSHHGVSFQIEKPLGSSGALKALMAEAIDIAVTSKPLKPEESAGGAMLHHFGKTPLAIVVGQNVPVKNITTRQLEDIYSGVLTKWPNGETVRLVLRPLEDIDTKTLMGLSPGMADAVAKARNRHGMIIAVTDPESNEAVSKTIGGIGASGLTGIMTRKTSLRVISLNGVMPNVGSISDGSYPMAKEIHFVTKGKPSESARRFINFLYSTKGRAIAKKAGVLITATGKDAE